MMMQSLTLSNPKPGMKNVTGTLFTSCKLFRVYICKKRESREVPVLVLHWLFKSGLTLDIAGIVFKFGKKTVCKFHVLKKSLS